MPLAPPAAACRSRSFVVLYVAALPGVVAWGYVAAHTGLGKKATLLLCWGCGCLNLLLALATATPGGTSRMLVFLALNGFLGGGWVTMDKAISGDVRPSAAYPARTRSQTRRVRPSASAGHSRPPASAARSSTTISCTPGARSRPCSSGCGPSCPSSPRSPSRPSPPPCSRSRATCTPEGGSSPRPAATLLLTHSPSSLLG